MTCVRLALLSSASQSVHASSAVNSEASGSVLILCLLCVCRTKSHKFADHGTGELSDHRFSLHKAHNISNNASCLGSSSPEMFRSVYLLNPLHTCPLLEAIRSSTNLNAKYIFADEVSLGSRRLWNTLTRFSNSIDTSLHNLEDSVNAAEFINSCPKTGLCPKFRGHVALGIFVLRGGVG